MHHIVPTVHVLYCTTVSLMTRYAICMVSCAVWFMRGVAILGAIACCCAEQPGKGEGEEGRGEAGRRRVGGQDCASIVPKVTFKLD